MKDLVYSITEVYEYMPNSNNIIHYFQYEKGQVPAFHQFQIGSIPNLLNLMETFLYMEVDGYSSFHNGQVEYLVNNDWYVVLRVPDTKTSNDYISTGMYYDITDFINTQSTEHYLTTAQQLVYDLINTV